MIRVLVFLIAVAAYGVTLVPAGSLLQHNANFFDLAHKRLRFTPRKGLNEYKLSVDSAGRPSETGRVLGVKDGFDPNAKSWTVRLAFAFPFGGKRWTELVHQPQRQSHIWRSRSGRSTRSAIAGRTGRCGPWRHGPTQVPSRAGT